MEWMIVRASYTRATRLNDVSWGNTASRPNTYSTVTCRRGISTTCKIWRWLIPITHWCVWCRTAYRMHFWNHPLTSAKAQLPLPTRCYTYVARRTFSSTNQGSSPIYQWHSLYHLHGHGKFIQMDVLSSWWRAYYLNIPCNSLTRGSARDAHFDFRIPSRPDSCMYVSQCHDRRPVWWWVQWTSGLLFTF